ncbi:hypothetical protein [Aegicerativicinus sediminis]
MRTNNGKVKNIIISVYFILIVLAIVLATVFRAFRDVTENSFLTFILIAAGFAVAFIVVHSISKYFEYDSDGLKVIVINRGLLLSDYWNYREHVVEFEKEDLVAFKIKDYLIYKRLTLNIRLEDGSKKWEYFNVTLVPKRKLKFIKQSLSKMIKYNIKARNS